MDKKLYRSTTDKKLCGVCAGLAKFVNIDVTVVRLLWVFAVIFGGFGIAAYIVCALIIPEEPVQNTYQDPYYAPTNIDEDK